MAAIYILEFRGKKRKKKKEKRRHACYTEGKHKERITSIAVKIPWENSISV